MSDENLGWGAALHALIPLADFKALLGLDDREDCLNFASVQNSAILFQPPSRGEPSPLCVSVEYTLAAFCLITATYTIEKYCKRRLLRKKQTDYLTFTGEHIFTLREYPVRKVLTVYAATTGTVQRGEPLFIPENIVDPKHYYCLPDEGTGEDLPFLLVLRPPRGLDNLFVNEKLTEPHAVLNHSQTHSMSRVPSWACLAREEMGIQVRYLAGYATGRAPADLASACLELAAGPKNFTVNGDFFGPTLCHVIHLHVQRFACIIGRGT
jgi:hypothetical protein